MYSHTDCPFLNQCGKMVVFSCDLKKLWLKVFICYLFFPGHSIVAGLVGFGLVVFNV